MVSAFESWAFGQTKNPFDQIDETMMSQRTHVFGGAMGRVEMRTIARCISTDCDIEINAGYAATIDRRCGSDDAAAGTWYAYLFAVSDSPREVIELEILAADILRQARRTRH